MATDPGLGAVGSCSVLCTGMADAHVIGRHHQLRQELSTRAGTRPRRSETRPGLAVRMCGWCGKSMLMNWRLTEISS